MDNKRIPYKEFLKYLKNNEGLGIKRSDMPQIPKDKHQDFMEYLNGEGIIVEKGIRMPPKVLRPVQETFKDKDIDELIETTDMTRPILISKDHYIVDGHHRWLVGLYTDKPTVLVNMINLNVNKALEQAKLFEEQND